MAMCPKPPIPITPTLSVGFTPAKIIGIKKILKADYPRGRAKGYYANFILAQKPKI
jgi:hypothetical protein